MNLVELISPTEKGGTCVRMQKALSSGGERHEARS